MKGQHELYGRFAENFNKSVDKVVAIISSNCNPYNMSSSMQLHNLTTAQVVGREVAERYLNFFDHEKEVYMQFRGERLISKSKLVGDTITKVNLPKFGNSNDNKSSTESTKAATRRFGFAQREIGIERSRLSMKEILQYNHVTQDILFNRDLTAKPDKPELVRELEKYLQVFDYTFSNSTSPYQTAVVMEFTSEVRKIPKERIKLNIHVINDLFERAYTSITSANKIKEIHVVYDSYI